jgi:hypothetical protein
MKTLDPLVMSLRLAQEGSRQVVRVCKYRQSQPSDKPKRRLHRLTRGQAIHIEPVPRLSEGTGQLWLGQPGAAQDGLNGPRLDRQLGNDAAEEVADVNAALKVHPLQQTQAQLAHRQIHYLVLCNWNH